MTWNAFHHRGEILRSVVEAVDARRDGRLPLDIPGVSETFRDELDLLAALHLKWHARLSGNIERELMAQPMDLESAVAHAWRTTNDELPGVRLVLDRYAEFPTDPEMAAVLSRAQEKEWVGLAAAAGLANTGDDSPRAARVGERVVALARSEQALPSQRPDAQAPVPDEAPAPSFVERIKAVLVA